MHTTIISAENAFLLSDEALFFDCRHELSDTGAGRTKYENMHIPGAWFLHLDDDLSGAIISGETGRHPLPDMDAFAVFVSRFGLSEDTQVVCYDDKGGGIAARLWWMLRVIGHKNTAVLDGGIQAWAAAYPLEAGNNEWPAAVDKAAPHLAPYSPLCTRDRAQIDVLRNDQSYTVIDSRTAPRYRGEEEPIDPVAGHIEGAINLPWPENLKDGKLKSKNELKIRFSGLRADAGNNVFYCGSGVTACHNILAYTHAYGKLPLLYPGSWSEWITEL
ncbi:sulfurtransferase [Neolewinella aurantiaca]|uniref:Sulfurtransferase n=1 Tax=Neolewinella aurantiaca TaxID=2602767 RepID=A0A5C7FTI4_9BACT|nr:sulfurtransferase [Neolewinella aurantiaca]TXF89550.1 sulfurtransferase [Neolewinella aurantiaca]